MLTIVEATLQHIPVIRTFILELADYEKLSHEVVVNDSDLKRFLFEEKLVYSLLAYEDDVPVGFALYFFNFSTFLGKKGLYLEDIYIKQAYRGKGYGLTILKKLAQIALDQQCGRMEWSVLDWNAPAITFYKNIGAKPMDEWTVFRMDLGAIRDFVASD